MGGYGSGGAAPGEPGPLTMEILERLWKDVSELQAAVDSEGLTVYDDKGRLVPNPNLRPLRDAQLMICRIEPRKQKPGPSKGKLDEFVEQR